MKRCITKAETVMSLTKRDSGAKSITDRMKMFDNTSAIKKGSLNYNTNSQLSNIHSSNINSIHISNDLIYTSDYTGFIKIWSI
jgi:hypothetical protein